MYYYCLKRTRAQTVMACPKNVCNILLNPCQTGVPGKKCGSIPQPLTFLTTAPTFLLSKSQTGTHLIQCQDSQFILLPAPTCSAGNPLCSKQRKSGNYCQTCSAWKLFVSLPSTHTTVWKSLCGNTKINILIKLLLMPLK